MHPNPDNHHLNQPSKNLAPINIPLLPYINDKLKKAITSAPVETLQLKITEMKKLIFQYSEVIDDYNGLSLAIPKKNPFWVFKKKFEAYVLEKELYKLELGGHPKKQTFLEEEMFNSMGADIIHDYLFESLEYLLCLSEYIICEDETDINDDNDYSSIDSAKALQLYHKLEGSKELLKNNTDFKEDFQNHLNQNYHSQSINLGNGLILTKEFETIIEDNKIESLESFIVYYLKQFLKYAHLEQIANTVTYCQNFDDLIKQLKLLTYTDFPSKEGPQIVL